MNERLDPTQLSPEAQKFKEFLSARMIGQERAINTVVKAYSLSRSRLARRNKPILTMFSAGPSGVGKTLLAQLTAEFIFGSRNALTKVPCEGFTEKHELAALLGSPPGYVGFDEPPMLAQENIDRYAGALLKKHLDDNPKIKSLEAELQKLTDLLGKEERGRVRSGKRTPSEEEDRLIDRIEETFEEYEKACHGLGEELAAKKDVSLYSVILFDEIEKAHPAVHNFLLGVLDEGHAKLMNGDDTSFHNSFIFMTSNVGSGLLAKLMKQQPGLGFGNNTEEFVDLDTAIFRRTMKEIKVAFHTEFVGRIKEHIVVFHPLPIEGLRAIEDVALTKIVENLKTALGAILHISDEVKEFILRKATDHQEYGARLIEQKVQSYILEPLSNLESSGQIVNGDVLYVHLENGDDPKNAKVVFFREGDLSKSPYLIKTQEAENSEKPK